MAKIVRIESEKQLRKSTRKWLIAFMILLTLSGVTAFPIESELNWLAHHSSIFPTFMREWIFQIYNGVKYMNSTFPQLSYGTDWLAFAHIVIGVAFIGPLIDPVKNVWVLIFGMIACAMVFPLAIICGSIRLIPFYWRMIDCAFGVFGFIPLWICYVKVRKIEKLNLAK